MSDEPGCMPLVLIVTGPPCSGKTTLARHLAQTLRLPLMTKDTLKESLFETLGWGDVAWSKRLSGASMELLHLFVEAHLAVGQSCLVEANFNSALATAVYRRLAQQYDYLPIQINLSADPHVLAERWRERQESGVRHPGHHDIQVSAPTVMPIQGRLEPLGIGGHVIGVNTTDLAALDERALCTQIIALRDTSVREKE